MDGSIRRLVACSLVIALAGCDPSPKPTQSPTAPSPNTSPIANPSPTLASLPPSPAATAGLPTSIDLPDGFDAIPWASVNPATGVVSIGVLGHPATTTRITTEPSLVFASGGAIVLYTSDRTVEIVEAATGETMAMFDRDALRVAVPDDPGGGISDYEFSPSRLWVDVEHGYLYDMSPTTDGVLLRRFGLDGSGGTRLARLAPDPADEYWDHVDFVVGPTGEVDAVACPPENTAAADHRCRLWRIAPGASPPLTATHLPSTAARPCYLIAANEKFVIGSSFGGCHADGGLPALIPYTSVNLRTGATQEVTAASRLSPFLVQNRGGIASLIGNDGGETSYPNPYPPVAVVLAMDAYYETTVPFIEDERHGWVWALVGAGPGWSLRESFGPEYAACKLVEPESNPCPLGPVVLDLGAAGQFTLPPGTYGEIAPPDSDDNGF